MIGRSTGKYAERERGRGQTLAEFAISLPILLILLFGVIEFGRLFQSWVTIQNSARTAARYAITGAYNDQKYDLEVLVPCSTNQTPMELVTVNVPIHHPTDADYTRTVQRLQPAAGADVAVNEYLYATWYSAEDCFPDDDSLQNRRDLLRLASIYDEARRGAAGLRIDPSLTGSGNKADFERYLFNTWENPARRVNSRDWFNVIICSGRNRVGDLNYEIANNPDDPASLNPATRGEAVLRFYTDPTGQGWDPYNNGTSSPVPACLNKEQLVTANPNLPNNYNVPWQDAGSAGERITIMVTYNHPLITPLGLAEYVQLRAIRSAVNESFRVTNAERALGPSGAAGPSFVSPTPEPATATFTPTETPPATATPTHTPTPLPTATAEPFQCDNIDVRNVTFNGPRFFIQFSNANLEPTYLTRSFVRWPEANLKADFSNIYLAFKGLDSVIYWQGNSATANVSPIDSNDASRGTFFPDADLEIPTTFSSADIVYWEGVFINGPSILSQFATVWDFGGTIFYFDDPNSDVDCEIELELPPPPPAPTEPPPGFVPSATYTPDCASSQLTVRFIAFESLGDVRLQVENRRAVVAELYDFFIQWPADRGIRLVRVVAGGINPNDVVDRGGSGVVVWENLAGHASPPTSAGNPAHGTYLTNYTFPPNSITNLWLDFTGSGAAPLTSVGVHQSNFNGTWFRISCGRAGGGPGSGGGGGGGSGDIFLNEVPPPASTVPPPPTNTPGPTPTPSNTPTPRPPTNTFTPAPPTNTFTPSPTRQGTNTFTPTNTPQDLDLGGEGG